MSTSRNGRFIRQAGNPSGLILGTGNAVFFGGLTLVDPAGRLVVLVPKTSVWIWPGNHRGGVGLYRWRERSVRRRTLHRDVAEEPATKRLVGLMVDRRCCVGQAQELVEAGVVPRNERLKGASLHRR